MPSIKQFNRGGPLSALSEARSKVSYCGKGESVQKFQHARTGRSTYMSRNNMSLKFLRLYNKSCYCTAACAWRYARKTAVIPEPICFCTNDAITNQYVLAWCHQLTLANLPHMWRKDRHGPRMRWCAHDIYFPFSSSSHKLIDNIITVRTNGCRKAFFVIAQLRLFVIYWIR